MANNTVVEFVAYAGQSLTAKLSPCSGATGTPNTSGYACTEVTDEPGLYRLTVSQALVGEFAIHAVDGSDELAMRGYVRVADDTETYRAYDFTDSEAGTEVTGSLEEVLSYVRQIGSGVIHVVQRSDDNKILFYLGEQDLFTLTTEDDYSLLSLQLVFEDKKKNDVIVIPDADIAKTSASISFTVPAELTASIRRLVWSLRKSDTDKVLAQGTAVVDYAAKEDS